MTSAPRQVALNQVDSESESLETLPPFSLPETFCPPVPLLDRNRRRGPHRHRHDDRRTTELPRSFAARMISVSAGLSQKCAMGFAARVRIERCRGVGVGLGLGFLARASERFLAA